MKIQTKNHQRSGIKQIRTKRKKIVVFVGIVKLNTRWSAPGSMDFATHALKIGPWRRGRRFRVLVAAKNALFQTTGGSLYDIWLALLLIQKRKMIMTISTLLTQSIKKSRMKNWKECWQI